MYKLLLSFIAGFFILTSWAQDQKTYGPVPSVNVKTMDGEVFDMSTVSNDGKPIIITFWATWCKPCIKEHDAINEVYLDWVDETGVKLYAVSIDNARSSKKVLPMVNGKSWEFDVLLDENGDLKRAMNVNIPPHTFIVDGSGQIVWQHVGYLDGDEVEYIEIVEKLLAGETIE
ncbi:MAG: TlpA family protein disulfide reductase [Bacteroidales bacterium]|nr:TlpA family protein disulfide reductase [Bacteroidales bacterium]